MAMSQRPIDLNDRKQFLSFCRAAWSWDVCESCHTPEGCADHQRPDTASRRLEPYWWHCKRMIGPGPSSEENLISLIASLRENAPTITRQSLREQVFPTAQEAIPPQLDQNAAIDAAVKILFMSNCSPIDHWSDHLETGMLRRPWRDNVVFASFIEDMLPPQQTHPVLSYPESLEYADFKSSIKATSLVKYLGIRIQPTDDVRDHLYFDTRRRELRIFHFTGFLKQQLQLTKDAPRDLALADALKLGALPRQFVLEILDSLQHILFPLSDKKSRKLLQSLIATLGLDPDMLRFDFASNRNPGEEYTPYYYFADRLADLRNELEAPRPQGWVQELMERKSGARYVMLATLVGIGLAILLGIASLAVGSYQTWLAYQAWQHPVSNGP